MTKTNEADLRKAIIAIARADTSAGGESLLELMKARNSAITANDMIVEWGDERMAAQRPILAVHTAVSRPNRGSKERLEVDTQLDAFVERASGDLGEKLLDRLEKIITYSALSAEGIEAAPWLWARRSEPDDRREGSQRRTMTSPIWLER